MSIDVIKDHDLWDTFVDESPCGMLSHKWNYLKIIERHSHHKLFTYGIYKGESLIGIIPIFCKREFGMNMVFSPPPKTVTPYSGIVMSGEYLNFRQSKRERYLSYFVDEMEKELNSFSPVYRHINLVPNFIDIRAFKWSKYIIQSNYTFIMNLNDPLEYIYKNFSKDLRNKLRIAEKRNLSFIPGDSLSDLHRMLERRYNEQNLSIPIISKDYLSDLIKSFPDNIYIYYIVDGNGEVITATATQEYKSRFLDWIGSPKSENGANEYMEWSLLQQAKLNNYHLFDFVGANNNNISVFKSKFSPQLQVYFSVSKKNLLGRAVEWSYINFFKKI